MRGKVDKEVGFGRGETEKIENFLPGCKSRMQIMRQQKMQDDEDLDRRWE
jgi:hypothetical protein